MTHRIALILIVLVFSFSLIASSAWGDPVEPGLAARLSAAGPAEQIPVIVRFADDIDLRPFRLMRRSEARRQLVRALKSRSEQSGAGMRQFLRQNGVEKIKGLWHINALAFSADRGVVASAAQWPGVVSVRTDALLTMEPVAQTAAAGPVEPNLDTINAPAVWTQGFDGTGVTVAIIDSGVDLTHPELTGNWRGWPGDWFDPVDSTSLPEEKSFNSHGTAVAGIAVGQNVSRNIGVAPGATWIAASPFFPDPTDPDVDVAFASDLHASLGWALDPDDDGDPADAPDVVNNSWGILGDGSCDLSFQNDIDLLKAAGIAVVFAAGNEGPLAATSSIPGNNSGTIAVGATDNNGILTNFSSRGPSPCDAPGEVYPELVAPGLKVVSAFTDIIIPNSPIEYAQYDGTSFSAPHVSGALALLRQAYPSLPVEDLENALMREAVDLGVVGPDNDTGHGLVDVHAAWQSLGDPILQVIDPTAPEDDLTLDFGAVSPGSSLRAVVTLRNAGNGTLSIDAIDSGALPAVFSVEDDQCSGAVLANDESCTLTLGFSPDAHAAYSGSIGISSNDPVNPAVTITLSGAGNTPPPAATPTLPISFSTVTSPVRMQWIQTADPDGDDLDHYVVIAQNDQFFGAAETFVGTLPGSGVATASAAGLLLALAFVLRRKRARILLVVATAGLLLSCGSGGGGGGHDGATVNFTLSGLSPGTYFWKVRTVDELGASVESASRSFTVR